jgi:hypothetical protein
MCVCVCVCVCFCVYVSVCVSVCLCVLLICSYPCPSHVIDALRVVIVFVVAGGVGVVVLLHLSEFS